MEKSKDIQHVLLRYSKNNPAFCSEPVILKYSQKNRRSQFLGIRMMSTLLVEKGPNKGQSIKWNANTSKIIVGRGQRASFTIDDTSVSRNHFKIYKKENQFFVEDLGSRNGTIVDGSNIDHPVKLEFGTCIQIGETIFIWTEESKDKERDPLIATEICGYLIEELLGKGGMGRVYRAKQISLERSVALKILSPKFVSNEIFIQKFIEEARASAKLNHPNIVQGVRCWRTGWAIFFFNGICSWGLYPRYYWRWENIACRTCCGML